MGYLGATWTQVFTRARGADMSFKDVKIKIPDRGMWMTSCTGSERGEFGGIWKKSELRTKLRTGRVDFRGSLRPDEFVRYGRHTCWGVADGKASIERLCISLLYVETFNSKVIKGFVPELRSRYVFFVFRDSYVLCIYVTNILCTFRISVSWVCYKILFLHTYKGWFVNTFCRYTVKWSKSSISNIQLSPSQT